MRSCLSRDGHVVPAQCCLCSLAISLFNFWLRGGCRILSSCCLSILGQVLAPALSPAPRPGQALGFLGEEAQFGQ